MKASTKLAAFALIQFHGKFCLANNRKVLKIPAMTIMTTDCRSTANVEFEIFTFDIRVRVHGDNVIPVVIDNTEWFKRSSHVAISFQRESSIVLDTVGTSASRKDTFCHTLLCQPRTKFLKRKSVPSKTLNASVTFKDHFSFDIMVKREESDDSRLYGLLAFNYGFSDNIIRSGYDTAVFALQNKIPSLTLQVTDEEVKGAGTNDESSDSKTLFVIDNVEIVVTPGDILYAQSILVDPSYPFFLVPASMKPSIQILYDGIGLNPETKLSSGFLDENEVDCKKVDDKQVLVFKFQGEVLKIKLKSLIFHKGEGCFFGVKIRQDKTEIWVLGVPIFKNYDVAIHLKRKRISFGTIVHRPALPLAVEGQTSHFASKSINGRFYGSDPLPTIYENEKTESLQKSRSTSSSSTIFLH